MRSKAHSPDIVVVCSNKMKPQVSTIQPPQKTKQQRHSPMRASTNLEDARKREEDYAQASDIMFRLATRKYHLPDNSMCQDWVMYIQNNHPVFGIFCHHKLHPLRLGQRLLLLLGSIAFGLIITSITTLSFAYAKKDEHTALLCIKLFDATNGTLAAVETNVTGQHCRIALTWEMITLWTLGGLVHTSFDLLLWFMSACCCCLPGAIFGHHRRLRKVGSYVVLVLVAMMIAVAIFAVILRAKYEAKKETLLAGTPSQWRDPDSFSFALGYLIEQILVWFVYWFILASILFSGVLAWGRIPILGGRPYEMRVERRQKEKERRKLQQLSTITTVTMSGDEHDIQSGGRVTHIRSDQEEVEIFCDIEFNDSNAGGRRGNDRSRKLKPVDDDDYSCQVAITRKN